MDALRDLDDPLTLTHLFAVLPAEGAHSIPPHQVGRAANRAIAALRFTHYCPRLQMCLTQGLTLRSPHRQCLYCISSVQVAIARQLALEWQAYVVRAHALRRVFVSVKGFYFQVQSPSSCTSPAGSPGSSWCADRACLGDDAPCSRRSLGVSWRCRLRSWGRRSHGWCRTSWRRWAVPTLQFCMMMYNCQRIE
jgi:Pescadillo N-terminus